MKYINKKAKRILILFILLFTSIIFVQCADDYDNGNAIVPDPTCDDGIKNGDEEGIDCGGSFCPPCGEESIDFSGVFVQKDIAGRPGANIFFGASDLLKDIFNTTEVSNREEFQTSFVETLEGYHNIYAVAMELPEEELNYETNILNWDANTFAKIMARFDALQVAPNGPTTYYDANTNMVFTGRKLSDDSIDITLMLMFGGTDGTRFDGNNGTPQLTTDAVDSGNRDFSLPFPYLEEPLNE